MQYLGNKPVQGISRTKNLVPQRYYIGKIKTSNGVTAVGLDNGMLRITGTSTARPILTLIYEKPLYLPIGAYSAINANLPQAMSIAYSFKLADGTTKTLYVSNSSNKTTLTQDAVAISVFFYGFVSPAVYTYDYIVPIMLVEYDGYYLGEYQPYLQRYNMYMYDNLIKQPYFNGNNYTHNGITFTVDEQTGWIIANGTSTGQSDYWIKREGYKYVDGVAVYESNLVYLSKGKYIVKGSFGGVNNTWFLRFRPDDMSSPNKYIDINTGYIEFEALRDEGWTMALIIKSGAGTVNNLAFKPELIKLIGD